MSIYWDHPHLLLGSWLKRLANNYQQHIVRIYNHIDIDFETSWFPVFFILSRREEISIGELAEILDVSQPGISQMVSALEKKELIQVKSNREDARRKDVHLSSRGLELVRKMEPVWTAIDHSLDQLLNTSEETAGMPEALKIFEHELNGDTFSNDVLNIYKTSHFDVQNLNGQMKESLFEYFRESSRVEFIYPEDHADVKVALIRDEIVGAIAYEFLSEEEFVLHNLFVKPVHRLKGIAKKLLSESIGSERRPCILMYHATPELVDLLLKCSYTFKVELQTT